MTIRLSATEMIPDFSSPERDDASRRGRPLFFVFSGFILFLDSTPCPLNQPVLLYKILSFSAEISLDFLPLSDGFPGSALQYFHGFH
jgi:hypothetical protein